METIQNRRGKRPLTEISNHSQSSFLRLPSSSSQSASKRVKPNPSSTSTATSATTKNPSSFVSKLWTSLTKMVSSSSSSSASSLASTSSSSSRSLSRQSGNRGGGGPPSSSSKKLSPLAIPATRDEPSDSAIDDRIWTLTNEWDWEKASAKAASLPEPPMPPELRRLKLKKKALASESVPYHKKTAMGERKRQRLLRAERRTKEEELQAGAETYNDVDDADYHKWLKAVAEEGFGSTFADYKEREKYRMDVGLNFVTDSFEVSSAISQPFKTKDSSKGKSKPQEFDRILKTTIATSRTPGPQRPQFPAYDKTLANKAAAEARFEAPAVRKRNFPKTVSLEDMRLIESLRTTGPMSTVISNVTGAEVQRKDILTLKGSTWLNDEPITFYSVMINMRSKEAEKNGGIVKVEGGEDYKVQKAHCFNSFFYKKFTDKEKDNGGYKSVKRWTKKTDLWAHDVVIVPINQGNSHWVCSAINFKLKRFEYYDSLGSKNPTVYLVLRDYLTKEWADKKMGKDGNDGPLDLSEWTDYWDNNVPKQENGCDCGIFTCQFMESLSRSSAPFDFGQSNMAYFRLKMVLEMKKKELLVEPFL